MSTVADVISTKGPAVHRIAEQATVNEAVGLMNEHKIGALVAVNGDGEVSGIFTERDVLRRVLGGRLDPTVATVGEVMTRDVVCCEPTTSLEDVRVLMKQRRIRHLPVVDDSGKVAGMISIGDVNAHFAQDHEIQLRYLREYINGRV